MTTDPETRNLLDAARQGEREAIEKLFARLYPELLQAVRFRLGSKLRDRLDSLDVAQSVYLEAYRDLDAFKGKGSFRGWLLKILENKIRDLADFHRAQKRDIRRDAALNGIDVAHQASSTPSRQLMADETRSALEKAMDALSDEHRDVIIFHHYLDMSWQAVGEQMDRSESAAKMLFQRAIGKLKGLYSG